MNNYVITVYDGDIEVEEFFESARTAKGVEKKLKQKFKEYRRLEYGWIIEEVD